MAENVIIGQHLIYDSSRQIGSMLRKYGLLIACSLFLICAICYAISPHSIPKIIGWTTFIGETGMDLIISALALQLYFKTENKQGRLFGLLAASFISISCADSSFNLLQNIWGITNPSIFASSIFEIPLLIFLCLQMRIWWELFMKANTHSKTKKQPLLTYLPLIASSLLVFGIFIYFGGWKIDRFSGEGLYQLADVLVEATDFALVSICLAASANKAISCIAIGFLTIISSNYMIRSPVVALATTQNSPYEFTWIAGLILISYGILHIKHNPQKYFMDNWCYGINCLQSQIAVGGFCLGWFAIILFSIFAETTMHITSLNENLLKYLPPVIIIFLIITVILSSYFSKKLLKPLKELEGVIESYSSQEKFEPVLQFHDDYGIREYIDLKGFIKKALLSLHEQFTIERQTSTLAASVAHDIASSLAYMEMTLHVHNTDIPLSLKSKLNNSIQAIRNIAYNLLEKYRSPTSQLATRPSYINYASSNDTHENSCFIFLPHIIEECVSQKQIEWIGHPCEIHFSSHIKYYNGWMYATPRNVRRVISNLLNNAYEALQNRRQISITTSIENNSYLSLLISDTGCGIPTEHLQDILEGKSLKHSGKGLGLSGAKAYIESLGGKLTITSQVESGTNLKLIFPRTDTPSWFPFNITLNSDSTALVLDDDENICTLWHEHLSSHNINVICFNKACDLIDWCVNNSEKAKNAIYLFDHQLNDPIWTGLSLLDKFQVGKRGYLITSEIEETLIQKHCSRLGIWLMPKYIINQISLVIDNHIACSHLKRITHENNQIH